MQKTSPNAKIIPVAATILIGLVLWFIPPPEGVSVQAWHLLVIFITTIVGIVIKPLPMGAVAMLGIIATALTGTLTISEALSGFGNRVIWLLVTAFFISRGFIKTGLGARIAYHIIRFLGKSSLGLAYGLAASDLVLSPAIPSNTARAGGVIFPLVRSIALAYSSEPEKGTSRRIGSFLMKTSFQVTNITSAMFLTAMAGNLLVVQFAGEMGIDISWGRWALAAAAPGLLSLIVIPFLIYKLYPPEVKKTSEMVDLARTELQKMGRMGAQEAVMLGTFVLLLFLWIFGGSWNIHSTTTALSGLGILLITGTLSWKDILNETAAWNTLIWFSALVMMGSFLNSLGFIPWFGQTIGAEVGELGWISAFLILSLVYFYSHYLFASNTAHISSMYAPFLAVALAAGAPPVLAALVLAFFSNLFSSMTHYGTGPAPVFFGAGYVDTSTWWKLGALISVVNIIIWMVLGGLWWKSLGLW
jgi:DASS family divalent anion:Na+ symporter